VPNGDGERPLVYDRFSFAYKGGSQVVRDASVDLTEGKVVLMTGPSGAGKTTVCRAANGLIPHEFKGTFEGNVTVAGRYDTRRFAVSALSKIVGVLSQDPETQLFNPTVEDEIVFGACNYGLPPDVIR
jgi:energy-coupling factor transporter ATP-binding protein EcfA2